MKRLVLIVCVVTLTAVAAWQEFSARRSKEAVRAENVRVVQDAICAYTSDRGAPPETLDGLVAAGYLKALPGEFPVQLDSDPTPPHLN
jgi:general secretion pathway protein G